MPTPLALELAPVLARSLRELHEAVRASTGFRPETTTRRFTIALSDVGQATVLPRIAALLSETMPLARLRAIGIDSLVSLGGLSGPEVDVVLGPEEGGADIHTEKLNEQDAVLICREDHPALGKRSSAAILRHVLVEMAPGQGLRNISEEAYAKAGSRRTIVVTVPTFSAAAAVVAATDLVATVPASLFEALRVSLRLRALPLPIPPLTIATNLRWHERTHADPAAAAFRDIVRRAIRLSAPAIWSARKLPRRKRA